MDQCRVDRIDVITNFTLYEDFTDSANVFVSLEACIPKQWMEREKIRHVLYKVV